MLRNLVEAGQYLETLSERRSAVIQRSGNVTAARIISAGYSRSPP
jgi:hypothetical protein